MLHVYFGNNTHEVREKAHALIAALENKGHVLARIDGERYTPGALKDALGADSLFGESFVYLIDTPSGDTLFKDEFWELISHFASSSHTFVVIEGALLAPDKKKLEKYADSVDELQDTTKERYTMFPFADAFLAKDKKKMWMLLQEARARNVSAEEILGVLWWQIKTLRLASMTQSAAEAGVSPFPYKKAQGALSRFSTEECTTVSREILTMYHEAHSGKADGYLALERFVLSV